MPKEEKPKDVDAIKKELEVIKKALEELSPQEKPVDQQIKEAEDKQKLKNALDNLKEQDIRNAKWIYSGAITVTAFYCVAAIIGFLFLVFKQWPAVSATETVTPENIIKVAIWWGGLGGAVYAGWSLVYHLEKEDFDDNYILWYYLRPVIGMGLGLVTILLILGGFLILSGDNTTKTNNLYFIAGLSALAGMAQNPLINKISDLGDTFFAVKTKEKTDLTIVTTEALKQTEKADAKEKPVGDGKGVQ